MRLPKLNIRRGKPYATVKISQEAKLAAELIRTNYKPAMEMQEMYSLAILEYLHAYYPELEKQLSEIIERRNAASRGETSNNSPTHR